MRHSLLLAVAVGLSVLSVPSTQSPAQTTGAATAAPGLTCNGTRILDPFQGSLRVRTRPPVCCRSTTRLSPEF